MMDMMRWIMSAGGAVVPVGGDPAAAPNTGMDVVTIDSTGTADISTTSTTPVNVGSYSATLNPSQASPSRYLIGTIGTSRNSSWGYTAFGCSIDNVDLPGFPGVAHVSGGIYHNVSSVRLSDELSAASTLRPRFWVNAHTGHISDTGGSADSLGFHVFAAEVPTNRAQDVDDLTANFTTTSGTFVDTGLEITLELSATRRVLLALAGRSNSNGASADHNFRFVADGAVLQATRQKFIEDATANANQNPCMLAMTEPLSSGSHTFKVQAATNTGTLTLYGDSGAASKARFSALELW